VVVLTGRRCANHANETNEEIFQAQGKIKDEEDTRPEAILPYPDIDTSYVHI